MEKAFLISIESWKDSAKIPISCYAGKDAENRAKAAAKELMSSGAFQVYIKEIPLHME